jgi:hypothetical protein
MESPNKIATSLSDPLGRANEDTHAVLVERACVAQINNEMQIALVLGQIRQRPAKQLGVHVAMHRHHDLAKRARDRHRLLGHDLAPGLG